MLISCYNENLLLEPTITDKENIKHELSREVNDDPIWITLPNITEVSVSKMVNGADETLLDLNTSIHGGVFKNIQINATLRFKGGAFEGSRFVTIAISSEFGTATFSSSGSFDIPAIYNATIMGLDLSGIVPSDISFVYMAKDGKYYSIDVQHILVEPQSGKLQLINAELPHFSRYGWMRKKYYFDTISQINRLKANPLQF